MKTKTLLLFVLLCAIFTSCKKEDEGISKDEIIGKWNVTQLYNGTEWEPAPVGYMWVQFNSDNSYQYKYGTGTYVISGNTVISDVDGYKTNYNILEIDDKNATIEVTADEEDSYKVKVVKE